MTFSGIKTKMMSSRRNHIYCKTFILYHRNENIKMEFIYFFIFALFVSVNARRLTFSNGAMPIQVVETSYGQGNRERIDYLFADIYPRHLTTRSRVNFPTSGPLETYYQGIRAPGDERGHLVASQFSGPPQWYNLSPQNARVNRNAGYQSITTDWYGSECEVRRFLQQGGNRHVYWTVRMRYVRDSNRPDEYHLQVIFMENGRANGRAIDARIRNPFQREDSTFWICRQCRNNRHEHDELRRRGLIEGGCSRK